MLFDCVLGGKHPCMYEETNFIPQHKGPVQPGVLSPRWTISDTSHMENDLSLRKHDSGGVTYIYKYRSLKRCHGFGEALNTDGCTWVTDRHGHKHSLICSCFHTRKYTDTQTHTWHKALLVFLFGYM